MLSIRLIRRMPGHPRPRFSLPALHDFANAGNRRELRAMRTAMTATVSPIMHAEHRLSAEPSVT
jgi:hypothetical protein